nr:uncharacterized protein LOC111502693 [Leptinotarsa decemlineata]
MRKREASVKLCCECSNSSVEMVTFFQNSYRYFFTEKPSVFPSGLEDLLTKNADGHLVLQNRHKLDNNTRCKLVKIIIDYLIVQDKPTYKFPAILQEVAEEIVKYFPAERIDTYFIPYSAQNSTGKKLPTRGKLYSRFLNVKRSLSLNKAKTTQDKGASQKFAYSEHEKLAYRSLLQSTNNFDQVRQNWRTSYNFRRQKLNGAPLEYFNTFPALRTPAGSTLLLDDFNVKFPGLRGLSLHTVWPRIGSVVVELLKSKQIQHNDLQSTFIDMHVQSVKLLPFLFLPTQMRLKTTKRIFKLSRIEMAERFFLHVADYTELEVKLAERREKLKESSSPVHPFMVAVGQSVNSQDHFVVIDSYKYLVNDCLSAMDLAFKIFHALEIPYPDETKKIWQTIDYLVYKVCKIIDPGASVVVGEIEQKLKEM